MTVDIQAIMQEQKEKRLTEAKRTRLLRGDAEAPWAESSRGYLVVRCPACNHAAATRIEYTDRFEETEFDCDHCGVRIEAQLDWETVRNITDVRYKVVTNS